MIWNILIFDFTENIGTSPVNVMFVSVKFW